MKIPGEFLLSKWLTCMLIIFLQDAASAQFTFVTDVANTSKSGQKSVRLLGEVTSISQLGKFGGWLKTKKTATGFFRTILVNNCWYLVDPEGYLFFMVGVNSVVKGGGITLPDALRDIGTNTLGCWSDETINDGTNRKMPYCPRWNFMATYKNSTQRTKDLFADGIIPVFDPAYITFCDNHAKQLTAASGDPYLLGHFSDNELPIYDNTTYGDLLDRFLAITDKTDPNYLAAHNWMVARKGTGYKVTDVDREHFHGYLMGTYYRITNEAIKKYDPNHLYLGSRLHGGALSKPSIYVEAGKYVDIISINCYNVWTPSQMSMDIWSAGNKPFFITEFYAKAEDSGLSNESGAGWLVPTQPDRAKFFENFTLALIEHPGCVGFHHFKYIDDDGSNKGLVNASFKWYEPLKNSFHKVARDIYALREYLTNKPTGMQLPDQKGSIQIYPNPASGKFFIDSYDQFAHADIEIFSLAGNRIQQVRGACLPYELEMHNRPAGPYIVRIFQNKKTVSKQIVITN
jgi:hypothetical protein